MDGFRVIKLSEVIRQVDMVITCTGNRCPLLSNIIKNISAVPVYFTAYVSLQAIKTWWGGNIWTE